MVCHTLQSADLPRGVAPYFYLEKVMKRQWGSRRDTKHGIVCGSVKSIRYLNSVQVCTVNCAVSGGGGGGSEYVDLSFTYYY